MGRAGFTGARFSGRNLPTWGVRSMGLDGIPIRTVMSLCICTEEQLTITEHDLKAQRSCINAACCIIQRHTSKIFEFFLHSMWDETTDVFVFYAKLER